MPNNSRENSTNILAHQEQVLFEDVCRIIESARQRLASYANAEVITMNWNIGKRVNEDVLHNQRAEYGKQVLKNLSNNLTLKYGKGWSHKQLLHCLRLAETFSHDEIVSAAQRQLSWTHLKTIMYVPDELARTFYIEMCSIEHWDTRTLAKKIDEGSISKKTDHQLTKKKF